MPEGPRLRSRRNYVRILVLVVGLALLAAPLWVPALHLDDPTVTYERAAVVVDEVEGISYESDDVPTMRNPISDDLGCTQAFEAYRLCSYERYLQSSNATVPAGWTTGAGDEPAIDDLGRYEYVQLDGETYRPTTIVNESVQSGNGYYRVELVLESVPREEVLDAISVPADSLHGNVPAVVLGVLDDGSAATNRDVEVPATVFEADDGSYYRVYRAGSTPPNDLLSLLEPLLVVLLPGLGLGVLLVIGSDVRASPTEDGRERSER